MKLLCVALAIVAAAVTGCGHTTSKTDGVEIVHVWPSYLPDGLVPSHATERIGLEPESGDPLPRESDYTAVWATEAAAGASRADATGNDDPPRVWVNVGSTYYTELWQQIPEVGQPEAGPVEEADITDEGTHLELVYREGCCVVRVGAVGLDGEELRRVAEGFEVIDDEQWSSAWGDRRLVDQDE